MSISNLPAQTPFMPVPSAETQRTKGDAADQTDALQNQTPAQNAGAAKAGSIHILQDGQQKLLADLERFKETSALLQSSQLPAPAALSTLTKSQALGSSALAGIDQSGPLASPSTDSNEHFSVDVGNFMAMFQQFAQTMRNSARMERTTEMQSQVASLLSAADQMKSAAGLRLAAGIVQGSMQIAGGVVQVGAGAVAAGKTVASGAAIMQGKNLNIDASDHGTTAGNALVAKGKTLEAGAGMASSVAGAASGVAGGVGSVVGSGLTYAADLRDAEKTKLEVKAKVHETAVQHANETMQTMQDIIRDIRDKLQGMNQAALETNRSISRNI